jgi:hypothetical protein
VVGIVMYKISGKWEEEHRLVCLLQKWKARGRRNMGMVSGR